ncbi:hypothetical protein JQX13_00105 [Archangium violaceum]|nr:hypothetical protein [Archangium violaceum]QRK14250.1 hypothetical protein JQX13_00105 [Archangium violaceum]
MSRRQLAACFEEAPPEQQREWREAIARHHQQLAVWAENCPENFRALERLVFAERARLDGRSEEATRAYEEAIRVARENGATQYLGLAFGLHASALAAQMLKGQLTLKSKGPGQGAVATLELPLTSAGAP